MRQTTDRSWVISSIAVPVQGAPIEGGVYAVALPKSLELPAAHAFLALSL